MTGPDKAFSKGLRKHNVPQVSMLNSVYRSPNGEVKEYVPLSSRSRPSSRSNSARSDYVPLDSSRIDNDDENVKARHRNCLTLTIPTNWLKMVPRTNQ